MTHITESKFYGKRFTTPETRLIFADETRYQRWLNIEAALALVLSISHIFLNIKFDKKRKVCKMAQGGSMGGLI